jgi:hypothetical protein
VEGVREEVPRIVSAHRIAVEISPFHSSILRAAQCAGMSLGVGSKLVTDAGCVGVDGAR